MDNTNTKLAVLFGFYRKVLPFEKKLAEIAQIEHNNLGYYSTLDQIETGLDKENYTTCNLYPLQKKDVLITSTQIEHSIVSAIDTCKIINELIICYVGHGSSINGISVGKGQYITSKFWDLLIKKLNNIESFNKFTIIVECCESLNAITGNSYLRDNVVTLTKQNCNNSFTALNLQLGAQQVSEKFNFNFHGYFTGIDNKNALQDYTLSLTLIKNNFDPCQTIKEYDPQSVRDLVTININKTNKTMNTNPNEIDVDYALFTEVENCDPNGCDLIWGYTMTGSNIFHYSLIVNLPPNYNCNATILEYYNIPGVMNLAKVVRLTFSAGVSNPVMTIPIGSANKRPCESCYGTCNNYLKDIVTESFNNQEYLYIESVYNGVTPRTCNSGNLPKKKIKYNKASCGGGENEDTKQ